MNLNRKVIMPHPTRTRTEYLSYVEDLEEPFGVEALVTGADAFGAIPALEVEREWEWGIVDEELCHDPVPRDRSAIDVACGDHMAIHLGSFFDIISARRKRTDIAIIYHKHSSVDNCNGRGKQSTSAFPGCGFWKNGRAQVMATSTICRSMAAWRILEISSRRYLSIRSERTSMLPSLNSRSIGRESLGSCHPVGDVSEWQSGRETETRKS
jgi:hypothetical protein